MDIKFSKDEGGSPQGSTETKSSQSKLLLLLLILVAGCGYIYFFTDLIKPAQEQKQADAPPVTQIVKKPLPSADGKPVKAAADETEAKKDAVPAVKAEAVKPAPAPAPAAKPAAPETATPKAEVKKTAVPQPTAGKQPLPVAKAGETKAAPVEKKQPAVAEKKAVPAKDDAKKAADVKKQVEKAAVRAEAPTQPKKDVQKSANKEPAAPGAAVVPGRWTVLVGNYVLEEAMATDLARVRKAGLEAYVVPGTQKKTHMNRLQLAEFTDRASAQLELDKLKRHTSDAFMIDSAGMHIVYAGSYLLDTRAMSEKERLGSAGFGLTLKRVDVSIPTKNLTAGSFADKKSADDTLKKLQTAGVKATLSH